MVALAVGGLAVAGLAAGCATTSASSAAAGAAGGSSDKSATPPAASSCASGTPSTPAKPASSAGAPALDAVQFTDPSHGWAAGAGAIMATTDAGRTWTRQYSGSAALGQVDFTDAEHGWAAGGDTLLRTTDGGATWTALKEPCQGELNSLHFVSPAVGYAVATAHGNASAAATSAGTTAVGGTLLRTTNGGATWTAVTGGPANPQSACFASAADGYLGTPGHIWRTTDGGQRWTLALTEPGSSGGHQSADAPEIECAGPSALWVLFVGQSAAMGHSPYLAYATKDGRQWRGLFEEQYTEGGLRPSLKLPNGPGSYPGPFSAIDSGLAAFVGYTPPLGYGAAPVMLASVNGRGPAGDGLTSEGNVAAINQPYGASFLSQSQGWVVGENLKTDAFDIEATANAGRTWTTEYTIP